MTTAVVACGGGIDASATSPDAGPNVPLDHRAAAGTCAPRVDGNDQCRTDSDCHGDLVCECGTLNLCVPAQCKVDRDCGPGGYCSPVPVVSACDTPQYVCHRPGDECFNDSDCTKDGGTQSCHYGWTTGKWQCENVKCAG
jgi:hypothetical protein